MIIKMGEEKEPKIKIGKENYRHRRKTNNVRFRKRPKQESILRGLFSKTCPEKKPLDLVTQVTSQFDGVVLRVRAKTVIVL